MMRLTVYYKPKRKRVGIEIMLQNAYIITVNNNIVCEHWFEFIVSIKMKKAV